MSATASSTASKYVLTVAVLLAPNVSVAAPAAPPPGQTTTSAGALAPGQSTTSLPPPPSNEPAPAPEVAPVPTDTLAAAPAAPVETAPAPVQRVAPAKATPAVDDATWRAIEGRQVVIDTPDGPVEGELADSQGDTLVVVQENGRVTSLSKARASGVRVVQAPAPNPSPKDSMADLQPSDESEPSDDEPTAEEDEDEDLTEAQKRRKKRREDREHAILGAFAMQGATYSYWRGDGVNAGHASYAMDFGVGGNFSPKFGMYAMAGGLLGAKIDNKTIKANYGHVAALFVFGGKHYYSTVGAGVAFSRLRFGDDTLQKDRGLAMPFKLIGKIPLPKKLYIGLGLTYEFAALRGFSRFVNAIGGQLVIGRW